MIYGTRDIPEKSRQYQILLEHQRRAVHEDLDCVPYVDRRYEPEDVDDINGMLQRTHDELRALIEVRDLERMISA